MYTAIGIIVGLVLFAAIIVSYLEYKEEVKEQQEFKENLDKFETRTGALSNDRVNESTTIPKRNG
jgi:uncharacterized membrane-anchored protein YhcB (DUF1043 family)